MPKQTKKTHKKKQNNIPYYYKPQDMSYDEWQIRLRRQFAHEQKFKVKNISDHEVYSDFELSNPQTKQTYKVAIRSKDIGLNFCSCPDFTINTLGTCKHIEYLLHKLKHKRETKKLFDTLPERKYSSIFVKYGRTRKVVLRLGTYKQAEFKQLAQKYFDANNVLESKAYDHFEEFVESALKLDKNFRCYKDAIDYIIKIRDDHQHKAKIKAKYKQGINSLLDSLLKTKLYPYQKQGILFAAQAGRSIIADDMGLGKTIQAIGAAEMMARELGVEKALIVCPTSLKYQWKAEIEKFCSRSALVIEGLPVKRQQQYAGEEFFKIVTYNIIKNDLEQIKGLAPDLIILDEAQRIKNWKTQTAKSVKQLPSTYAMVLTGTPLENRLEELHSITAFVDKYKLGPLFRFLAHHQVMDKSNKVVGYKDLHKIKTTLSSILIRRTKQEVLKELPKRIDKNYFVDVTEEQMDIHDEHYSSVSRLVNKWRKFGFLSEKERQMLMIHLNCMRMVADSTFVLDQQTRFDTKIDELVAILEKIFNAEKAKVVIFSQWERMTRLVAHELEKQSIKYEYLHGGIPSSGRKELLTNFHQKPDSKVFLSTDAGGVGLNLQCASTVINLDCPWNPAVLEQRIGRVHRLGQKNCVDIINFISKGTIEENLLSTLKFKKSVFDGVLDNGKDEVFMGQSKFKQFMNGIEKMTDQQPGVEKEEREKSVEVEEVAQEQKVESKIPSQDQTKPQDAVNDLFTTGLNFLEKLGKTLTDPVAKQKTISSFVEQDQKTGKVCLRIPMPNEDIIEKAGNALNAFLGALKK